MCLCVGCAVYIKHGGDIFFATMLYIKSAYVFYFFFGRKTFNNMQPMIAEINEPQSIPNFA